MILKAYPCLTSPVGSADKTRVTFQTLYEQFPLCIVVSVYMLCVRDENRISYAEYRAAL